LRKVDRHGRVGQGSARGFQPRTEIDRIQLGDAEPFQITINSVADGIERNLRFPLVGIDVFRIGLVIEITGTQGRRQRSNIGRADRYGDLISRRIGIAADPEGDRIISAGFIAG
jgi:hypothetical protein